MFIGRQAGGCGHDHPAGAPPYNRVPSDHGILHHGLGHQLGIVPDHGIAQTRAVRQTYPPAQGDEACHGGTGAPGSVRTALDRGIEQHRTALLVSVPLADLAMHLQVISRSAQVGPE